MADVEMSVLRKRVRVVMDENSATQALLTAGDVETLSLDDLIDANVLTAVRYVELRAPWPLLDGVGLESDTTLEFKKLGDGKYMGRIYLPENMLRLLAVKLTSWSECARIITADDDAYRLQRSKWRGVGGSPEKPVAAIVAGPPGGTGKGACLETFSSANGKDSLEYVTMVMEPEVKDGKISGVSSRLQDAIVYLAAAMTCVSLGEVETAARLEATAWRLAGVEIK